MRTIKKIRLINNLGSHIKSVILVSQCDAQGRGPEYEKKPYPQAETIIEMAKAIKNILGHEEKTERFLVYCLDNIELGKK